MKQLELPFTSRGRRIYRRAKGVNRRAWKCSCKHAANESSIIQASDNAEARSLYQRELTEAGRTVRFLDIRAVRSPEHD